MSNKHKLTPKRRFKEFENADAWEQRKLGTIITVHPSKDLIVEAIEDEGRSIVVQQGDSPVLGYSNAEGFEGYINVTIFGDHTVSLYKPQFPFVIATDGVKILSSSILQHQYFYTVLEKYKPIPQGYKRHFSILKEQIANITVNKDEQKKIGEFFETIGDLITLHQRKLDKLKETKIAYISEMFPKEGNLKPERRFKGYKNEWKSIELEQIATMNARIGWQNLRTSEFLKEGDYMLITGTDFENGKVDFSTCHFVSKKRYEQDTKIQIQNGSILITKDGTLGKVAFVEELEKPATLNAGVFNVRIKDQSKVDEVFLFQYLRAPFLMRYVNGRATGGTIKHLNQNILVKFPILLPEKEEQIKIGKFLTNLDKMIESQQRVLSKLIDLKNAYLNEMFV